jgi:uncharacterized protein involved in exopolysaccharide biosynthesis
MNENTEYPAFSRRDFYYTLFKHKRIIFLIFLFGTLTTLAGVYIIPDVYEARATLLVKMGRENLALSNLPATANQQVVTAFGVRKEDINSEIEILKNITILEEIIQSYSLNYLFPKPKKPTGTFNKLKYHIKTSINSLRQGISDFFVKVGLKKEISRYEQALLSLQKNLSAQQKINTDVIEIKFRWHERQIAAKILDSIIEMFLQRHSQAHQISGEHNFLAKQVEYLQSKLSNSEDKLQKIKQDEDIISYQHQSRLLLEQQARVTLTYKDTETDLKESETKINELTSQMEKLRKSISPGFEMAYKEAEKELLLEEIKLKTLYVKESDQRKNLDKLNRKIEKLNSFRLELERLERQILIDEENFKIYTRKLEEARISGILDSNQMINVRVISPAYASVYPVTPKKPFMILMGMIFCLLVGIGLAFVLESLDHSIKTDADVRKYLQLPVLTVIPEVKNAKD